MTLEALGLWERMRAPESHWRRAARETMIRVVREQCGLGNLGDNAALLKAIDAAYPFGERKYLPYKMWLLERKLFRNACAVPSPPSRDETEVCSVARDELELHPERADEIRRMLDERAPNRLGRKCMACGARTGEECIDLTLPIEFVGTKAGELLVPHEARLIGHLDAGPLFEARS